MAMLVRLALSVEHTRGTLRRDQINKVGQSLSLITLSETVLNKRQSSQMETRVCLTMCSQAQTIASARSSV